MQTQNTPGPWSAFSTGTVNDEPALWEIYGAGGIVAEVQSHNPADARLISAAPDLLFTMLWLLEDLRLHAPKLGPLRSIAAAHALRESLT